MIFVWNCKKPPHGQGRLLLIWVSQRQAGPIRYILDSLLSAPIWTILLRVNYQNAPKEIKGVIFDMDGTLVDSLPVTLDGFNHGIISLGGQERSREEILKHFGPSEREILGRMVGSENAEEAYVASKRYLDHHLMGIPAHSGIPELLENLRAAGYLISIFTGRGRETTDLILDHLRLRDHFVTVVTSDHVQSPKPSPEGLYLCAKAMNLRPDQLIFVGDSHADIIAGRSAGAWTVAALWDSQANRAQLEPWKPHYWASRPQDVWDIFQSLKSES